MTPDTMVDSARPRGAARAAQCGGTGRAHRRALSRRGVGAILSMTLALSGCGSQLVDYRPRPIEQYRHFQVQDGLAVAVEPLTDGAEAERYFGSDLVSAGRLAVLVIVENRGSTSVLVSTDKIALGETQA